MNTLRARLIFPSKHKFWCNLFEFSPTKSICQNQYLPQLSSEIYEINFIKSDSPRAFQQHPESPPNSNTVFSLFNFHQENDSIINSFHTGAPNNLKPSRCTLHTSRASFLKTRTAYLGGRSQWEKQNKTKQPCFIDTFL